MAWRLTHTTPRIYSYNAPTIEPTVITDTTMEVSEKAARQQLAFYLQGWVEADPENRHVQQRDGLNAWCSERPAGCTCRWCLRAAAAAPEEAENMAWWAMGSARHVGSHVHLKRTDAPVTRATAPTWRVVDRRLDANGQEEPAFTLWSEHATRAEAGKGLAAAVRKWRNWGNKTAWRHSNSSYLLKLNRRPYAILAAERIA